MIHRTVTTVALLAALMLGFGSSLVQAESAKAAPTAGEKKAYKKKITDKTKHNAYIKKCAKKNKK